MPLPVESVPCDFAFGPFRLLKDQRRLLDGATPVRLGSRAFDLLTALIERAGEIVSRRDLEARAWPGTVVEETSLRVHMSSLRRAIGDGQDGARYIENVPGRGYCFVATVARGDAAVAISPVVARKRATLPRPSRMIGRAEALATLEDQLQVHRLLTIAGPGGIGKTTLALALANECADRYRQGVVFVDLAPIAEGSLVAATLASALDVPFAAQEPLASLMPSLAETDVLVVLDNCEHVIDAVAGLVGALLAETTASILATSREPLDVEGERTYRIAPLALPSMDGPLDIDRAMRSAAVELFVERATTGGLPFALTDDNVRDVCALTCQLDGLPLAVELVAARVASLGVVELKSRVGDHLSLLFRGRRSTAPRHQTLAAMLDWSYQLLSTPEQIVLRRLSVFRSVFDLDAACSVASGDRITREDVLESLVSLTSKSLVSVDLPRGLASYRLLDTTRAFATRKLRESEPVIPVLRRHALAVHAKLVAADTGRDGMLLAASLTEHGGHIEDVRAALDWCFSEGGELQIGIEIMAIAMPIHELGVLAEQVDRIERALNHLRLLDPPRPDLELRLNLVLAWPSVEPGWRGQRTLAILSRAAQLAAGMADSASRILALYSTWLGSFVTGDYVGATAAAESALEVARQAEDEAGMVLAERLLAQCRHFMGDHAASRRYAELTLARDAHRSPPAYPSIVPRRISMRILLARMLWIEGRPDSASRTIEECLAMTGDAHHHALLQTLAMGAIPLAFWRGEPAQAQSLVKRLVTTSRKSHSPYWESWGHSFEAVLEVARSGDSQRMPFAQTINAKELDCIASVADRWHHAVSLDRVAAGACGWCAPEILRKHGEYLLLRGDAAAVEAA
ncbi:MAG TPA: winged helix-turn-helix domain-containing protein, partial [Variovorax sp.]|nr:winged helix-turn-helix domain-containing protein [Variovorax sp.]